MHGRAYTIISLRATEVVARQGKRGTSDPWMGSANAPVISKKLRLGFRDAYMYVYSPH